jgi:sugar phosphate isomerase/epimerase
VKNVLFVCTGNICRSPEMAGDWEAALVELAPLANCWHVKNYRDSAPVPIDKGEIDYACAMQIMIQSGFSGWTSIESRVGTFKETQAASLAYLQNLEKTLYGIPSSLLESINNA